MNKRITKKRLNEFIEKVADIKSSGIPEDEHNNCYYSKIDGSYFTRVGMEESPFKMLLKKGITEQLQCSSGTGKTVSLGFNPEEKKWYGWSHRAIYGFTIGSKIGKGDCGYQPFDKKDFMDDCIRFWSDKYYEETNAMEEGNGIRVSWVYSNKVKNEKLRGTTNSVWSEYPGKWGKGEWIAKTMKDAKQMAIDFAEGVS